MKKFIIDQMTNILYFYGLNECGKSIKLLYSSLEFHNNKFYILLNLKKIVPNIGLEYRILMILGVLNMVQ